MVKKRVKITQEIFEERFYNIYDKNEYEVLGNYVSYKDKIAIKHLFCNKIWMVTPSDLLSKHSKCGNCTKRKHYTSKEYEEKMQLLIGKEYHLMSEYTESHNKVKIHHDLCNNDYEVAAYSVLTNKCKCPFCSKRSSRGERAINNILQASGIKFYKEYYAVINNKRAYIDFVLPELKIAIEYDGKQHYINTGFTRNDQKEVDLGKAEWASNNGYILINVPYWYDDPCKIYNYLLKYIQLSEFDNYKDYYEDNTIREVAEYRKTHTQQETADKFNISLSSVYSYFKLIYGVTYTEYRKGKLPHDKPLNAN